MLPLRDKVLVERVKKEEKKSDILLLDDVPGNKYKVVAVGNDVKSTLDKGDVVLIEPFGLTYIENDEKRDLYCVNENLIYMVL